jgi:negative regulator of flagellin synthesis FlgM
MNIQNNLQGLQRLFSSQEVAQPGSRVAASGESAGKVGADQTTLSSAASVAAAAAPDSDVRMEKVNAIQQALAAGTYNVPASEVANKMIDQMLGK